VDHQHRPRLRPKRAKVIALYTTPPEATTVICADELGPVIPRNFPPVPGWSPDGHRIKAPLEYSRGMDKTLAPAALAALACRHFCFANSVGGWSS
jgi:hypothetical protein